MHKLIINMINDKLFQEIKQYCEINNIVDIKAEINRLLRIGFNIEKYGTSPFSFLQENKIKELIKEQPIEDAEEKVYENKKEEVKPKKRIRIIKND